MATLATQPQAMLSSAADDALALYVHWPFCVSKCPYCDFNSHVRDAVDQGAWREALLADLAHEAALLPGRRLTSIFFGGGTPSLMEPATAAAIIAAAGVNRISLGLQSLDDGALAFLGRAHSVREGLAALDTAQRHFRRVSFDLIYALPGQELGDWEAMLGQALGFGTGHLSLYQLTIEPGTRFATMAAKHEFEPLDSEPAAEMFELTQEQTAAAGLPAYEISNHARPGEESRHNLAYWRYRNYAGVGPGAHGRRLGQRTVRHRKPENFLAAVARNGNGLVEEEPLSAIEAAREALVMGLRLAEGIDTEALAKQIGVDRLVDEDAVARLEKLGLVQRREARLATTQAGRLLLDSILAELAV